MKLQKTQALQGTEAIIEESNDKTEENKINLREDSSNSSTLKKYQIGDVIEFASGLKVKKQWEMSLGNIDN